MTSQPSLESFVQSTMIQTWETFKKDAVLYLIAGLLLIAVSVVTLGILAGPLTLGFIDIVRRRQRGEAASAEEVFGGMSRFAVGFLLVLIEAIAVIIGSFLLFLPALVVAYFMLFVFNVAVYRQVGVADSLKGSFELVMKNAVPVLVLFLIVGVATTIGSMTFIGTFITTPLSLIAITIAYEKLSVVEPSVSTASSST